VIGVARRVLAALAVGCGVLGLQSLPAASAAKAGSVVSVVVGSSSGEAASPNTRRAERSAARLEGAQPAPAVPSSLEAPSTPAAPPRGHRLQPSPPAGQLGGQAAGSGARKDERASPSGRVRRHEQRQLQQGLGPAGAAATAVSGESAVEQVEALVRKQKKNSGGGQKGKKEHKGKGKKGSSQEEASGTGSGAEDEAGSGGSLKEKAVLGSEGSGEEGVMGTAALAAGTPAGGTGPASISSALPATEAGVGAGAKAQRAGRHARRRAQKSARSDNATPGSAFVASPSLTTATAGTTHTARATPAKRAKGRSTQPALVKTLTRIVGVVPTPVRILIGALIALALLLGARSLLSGARTRRLLRQRGQLLEDVGLLQAALLPEPPERLGPVATSVAYRPADGPGAGGDFYDVFALENGEIAVVVGDVSGHGREALPHTALLRFTVRAYLEAGLAPRKALQTAGIVLDRQLGGSFATVLAATYNPRERTLTYASAGHPPPLVLAEGVRALTPVTSCSAPPIGAGMRTGVRQTVVSVPGSARLCFHTDGVTEARIGGELFGTERLADALAGLDRDADAATLLDRVAERTDARPDDMAACLLRVHDGEGDPAIALEQLELNRELLAGARVERFLLDCGVARGAAAQIVRAARARVASMDSVLLELELGTDREPAVAFVEDNVIHAAALATAGVSRGAS
jgi:Stage II sporulation protein E (SpoIIE)